LKLCECGCDQPVPLATKTSRRDGWIKGKPRRFINGHNKTNTTPRNTIKMASSGYLRIKLPEHPFADKGGYVALHRHIVETHLGYYLNPKEYHVHHIDFDKTNNELYNLVAIRPQAHHRLHALKQNFGQIKRRS
jgi:hypothetical protein